MTADFRKDFRDRVERDELRKPPSERKSFRERYESRFVDDYVFWREGGHDHNSAMQCAGIDRDKRAREREARREAAAKVKPAAAPMRLPLRPKVDQEKFKAEWIDTATVLAKNLDGDLDADTIVKLIFENDEELTDLWNGCAEVTQNPLVALRSFLFMKAKLDERGRLFARQKRKELEARVAELEKSLGDREWKGIWSAGDIYRKHNTVTRHGCLWVAIEDSIAAEPGKGSEWKMVVKRGADADPKRVAEHLLPNVLKHIDRREQQ